MTAMMDSDFGAVTGLKPIMKAPKAPSTKMDMGHATLKAPGFHGHQPMPVTTKHGHLPMHRA